MSTAMTGVRLSARESEVAELVRQGLTNREIAQRLFISERTVEGHVQQVLNKLGFGSRAQIAAWVAEGGSLRQAPATQPAHRAGAPRRRPRPGWLLVPGAFVLLVALVAGFLTLGRQSPDLRSVSLLASGDTYKGLAIAPDGTLFVATGTNVLRVTAGGVDVFAGTGQEGFAGDGDDARLAQFWGAGAVAVGAQGDVYISDTFNKRIRKVSADRIITTVAGNPSGGSDDGVRALDASFLPNSVAVTREGNLYSGEPYRIRLIDHSTGLITTVAGIGTPGYSGDNGPAIHALMGTVIIPFAWSSNRLYLADTGNNVIRAVDRAGVITTVVGDRTPGGGGDGGPASQARLFLPEGVAVGPGGDLYIADTGNNVIRRVHAGRIERVAGTGRAGSGLGGAPLQTDLFSPTRIALDAAGRLYVNDSGNRRLLRFVLPHS